MKEEIERQLMHFLVGIAAILLLLYIGREFMIAAVFFIVIIGMLIINIRTLGAKIALVEWFIKRFERKNIGLGGFGSACYAIGALIPLAFLHSPSEIAAVIFILAIGDGASTIIGMKGKHKISYNKEKTFEGTIAFFLASLPAYFFIGEAIIPLAIIAAIVESLPLRLDDNLTVPIACTIFFLVSA